MSADYYGKRRVDQVPNPRYVYCGAEYTNTRGNGGGIFEKIGCQFESCNSQDKNCYKGGEDCKSPDGDHTKAKCNTRDAWHDGKFHVWCDDDSDNPTCICPNHPETDAKLGDPPAPGSLNCPVPMKRCLENSCVANGAIWNADKGYCEASTPIPKVCICPNGTPVQAGHADCANDGDTVCTSDGCDVQHFYNAAEKKCVKCSDHCDVCTGPAATECVRCCQRNSDDCIPPAPATEWTPWYLESSRAKAELRGCVPRCSQYNRLFNVAGTVGGTYPIGTRICGHQEVNTQTNLKRCSSRLGACTKQIAVDSFAVDPRCCALQGQGGCSAGHIKKESQAHETCSGKKCGASNTQ